MLLSAFDAAAVGMQLDEGEVFIPQPMLRNPAMIGVRRVDGNAGWMNWLENWTAQQRSLGLAQSKLMSHFEAAGLDMSVLPDDFSF
jgi:polar amino acid transport system substrate-binding protein